MRDDLAQSSSTMVERTVFASSVNTLLSNFIRSTKDRVLPLGPAFSELSYEEAAAKLQLYRLHKKFEVLETEYDPVRRDATIAKMVAYDNSGMHAFDPSELDADVRHLLYNARRDLHEALRFHYRPSADDVSLPSGESYVTSRGNNCPYNKLGNSKFWTVTPECFNSFARTAYNHRALRAAAKKHFRDYESKPRQIAPGVYKLRKFDNKAMWSALKFFKPEQRAFMIFKAKLRCIVTFNSVCRITTVPKSNEEDRVIICANFCNMIEQLKCHNALVNVIQGAFDIDLSDSQVIHKLLLQDDANVTIDFSNASNSVYYSVCEWFFGGTRLWRDLVNARESVAELPGGDYHQFTMLSPMGNGYTFTVMTLLILAISRQLDTFSHVFGDDLIVHSDVAHTCLAALEAIGFKINEKKTFLGGNFRESCGGFTSNGKYITAFDFHGCNSDLDAVIAINKVGIIANSEPTELTCEWLGLHKDLLELVADRPHLLRGYRFKTDYACDRLMKDVETIQVKRRKPNVLTWANTLHESLEFVDHIVSDPSLGEGIFWHPRSVKTKQARTENTKRAIKRLGRSHNNDAVSYTLVYSAENEVYRYKSETPNKKGKPWIPVNKAPTLLGLQWINDGKSGPCKYKDTYIRETWIKLPVIG